MNFKKIKLVHESPDHFIMREGNSHFHVAKKGLDQEMVQKIQGFADGGEAEDGPLDYLEGKVRSALKVPPKSKPVPETQEEHYARIRKENTERASGQRSSMMSDTYSDGGDVPLEKTATDFFNRMKKPVPSTSSDNKYASGGEVPGMPGHNIDPKEMEEETKHLNTPQEYPKEWHNKLGSMDNFQEKQVQHFDVGGTASGLPPDFDNRVEAEKQNLAVNATAMPPENIDNNNILPATASPLPVNQFQTQAETNVAAQDQEQMSKAMQSEEAQKALTAQAVQDQNAKIQADNQVRMQAGLPQIPLTPSPQVDQSQMQVVPQQSQVSLSPQQSQPQMPQDPRVGTNLTGNFDKALRQIQGGINKNAELQAQGMAENAKNIQAHLEDQKQRAADYEKERSAIQAQNTELFNQVRDSKI
ncbi:MAG: hypothetical protein V4494_08205, partial [Chlamydiota bacterium]